MTLRSHLVGFTILLGLVTSRLAAQQLDLRDGSFGYVNADGSEVMALDSIANPSLIRTALCPRARVPHALRTVTKSYRYWVPN